MSINKIKKIIDVNLIKRIVSILNKSGDYKNNLLMSNGELSEKEMKFIDAVSKEMNDDEIKALKQNMIKYKNVMRNYKNVNVLKDLKSGKLKPKSHFAIDINFPARGFRGINSIK